MAAFARRNGRTRDRHRGAAAVEFALVVPLLLLLVFGCIDWGWFFFLDQVVTNAAREGARRGAVLSRTDCNDTNDPIYQSVNATLSNARLTRAYTVVCTEVDVGGADAVRVHLTYPAGSVTRFLSQFIPANAIATAVMRLEN